METMVRLDVPLGVTHAGDDRRLPHLRGAVRACAGQAVGLAETAPLGAAGAFAVVSPSNKVTVVLALSRSILCPMSEVSRGVDSAASGSLAGSAHPGRGLSSAPRFPGMSGDEHCSTEAACSALELLPCIF